MNAPDKAATLAHYAAQAALTVTPAEQAARDRRQMARSARMAGVTWPGLDATVEEPAGCRTSVMMGCAVFDVVYLTDDVEPYVYALEFGGVWVDPSTFGDRFCRQLEAALDVALRVDAWAEAA